MKNDPMATPTCSLIRATACVLFVFALSACGNDSFQLSPMERCLSWASAGGNKPVSADAIDACARAYVHESPHAATPNSKGEGE